MVTMKRAMVMLVMAACTSSQPNDDDRCTDATTYYGAEVDCADGNGVCMTDNTDGSFQCRPKCDVTIPGVACEGAGIVWYSEVTDIGHVCYCAPIGHGANN